MAGESPTKLIREVKSVVDKLEVRVEGIRLELDRTDPDIVRDRVSQLAERVAVLEDRVGKLEKHKEETDRRHWQFVYITMGAALALLSSLLVNLLLSLVKK
jgi:hypothetical protein